MVYSGKQKLKELLDTAELSIDSELSCCGECSNYPYSETASDMLCPFRTVVSEFTNWKSLGCSYFWSKRSKSINQK